MALSQCFRAFRGCRHKGHHRGLPHLLSVKRQRRPTQMGVRWSRVVWAVLCLQRGPKTSDDSWPAPVSRGRSDICIYVQRDTAVLGDMLTICGHKQELFRSNMESVFSIVWGIHIFFTSVGGCFFFYTLSVQIKKIKIVCVWFITHNKNLSSICLVDLTKKSPYRAVRNCWVICLCWWQTS